MDEILPHLRNPGMIRFPCKYQQRMVSHGFKAMQDFVHPLYVYLREIRGTETPHGPRQAEVASRPASFCAQAVPQPQRNEPTGNTLVHFASLLGL